jgi:hypothetical protein
MDTLFSPGDGGVGRTVGAAQRPPTAGIISRPERVSGDPTSNSACVLREDPEVVDQSGLH